jgi:glycerophosphoryl diester phosphodiesterase
VAPFPWNPAEGGPESTIKGMTLFRRTNGPVIVGHRGAGRGLVNTESGGVSENTLESFLAAHAAGVNWVETDAVRTADRHLVLHHDTVLPDGTPIGEITLGEATLRGITSLSRAFDELPRELGMIVEVKHVLADIWDKTSTADLVAKALIEERLRSGRNLASYGFDASTPVGLGIDHLRTAGVLLGIIAEGGSDLAGMVLTAERFGVPVVAAHTSSLLGKRAEGQMHPYDLEQVIVAAHDRRLSVLAWCPGLEEAKLLDQAGIDALCVDNVPSFMGSWSA